MSDFNKHVGKVITKEEAEKKIKNWKKTKLVTQSNFFGSDILLDLLNRPNVVGIRIHYGMDDENTLQPVLTPEYDSSVAATTTGSGDIYVNASLACPPACP